MWNRNALTPEIANASQIFEKLVAMYSESWRTYHNLDHISSCLGFFDDCRHQAESPDAIELAIWFHDCIYVVGAKDNEAKSRDWFLSQSEGILPEPLRRNVAGLIMDTRHVSRPESDDGKLLADIDLTSFGLPWEKYLSDGKNVQHEFSGGENGSSKGKKSAFLEKLLERDSIYYSPYYKKHFEKSAQDNIARHIGSLSKNQN